MKRIERPPAEGIDTIIGRTLRMHEGVVDSECSRTVAFWSRLRRASSDLDSKLLVSPYVDRTFSCDRVQRRTSCQPATDFRAIVL
ncbi:MAG: hypothetical protein KDC46_08565 [Thermoleophilia bacterium]|nr:hypothetical protein [Thermoleophilia bacterium]